eukprot:scaffold1481_cov153-Pinguiococcus_pyrenoidosus.AAC.1
MDDCKPVPAGRANKASDAFEDVDKMLGETSSYHRREACPSPPATRRGAVSVLCKRLLWPS